MYKILVVDDDKVPHTFIRRALFHEYILIDVFSGEEALELLKEKNKLDLILLDVEMPGINGIEVCEKFKSHPDSAHIPIIFLSARDDLKSQMQGFEAGADDYIVKPFQTETLQAKIKVFIQYFENRKNLSEKVEDAEQTALVAITGSSDLGQAIQFVQQSHNAVTHEQLANTLFRVTRNMALNLSGCLS